MRRKTKKITQQEDSNNYIRFTPEVLDEKECPNCGGSGYDPWDGGQCERCAGTGTVSRENTYY